jgi:Fe-S-cluster containining protein
MTEQSDSRIFSDLDKDTFRFKCHSDISCFNECCAGLRLILTPYDVLRLKNRLGMTGAEFLEKYTETVFEKSSRFPVILLKMSGDEKETCPFVSKEGCTVYTDRPGACRIYPIGRASKTPSAGGTAVKEKFFVVKEEHCKGFLEQKEWTLGEWLSGEGVDEYNAVNDAWLEIISSTKGLGDDAVVMKKMQMYLMACYNLEKFRDFLFKSSFFGHFEIPEEEKKTLADDEKALLLFAVRWLRFSLFGEKTMNVKGRG